MCGEFINIWMVKNFSEAEKDAELIRSKDFQKPGLEFFTSDKGKALITGNPLKAETGKPPIFRE